MRRKFEYFMIICLLCASFLLARKGAAFVSATETKKDSGICIAIDPGHGGNDPGKISINGAYEKDINLEISFKLQKLLENRGIQVILTRDTDTNLATDDSTTQKNSDMRNRVSLIGDAAPVLTVSIHQNSYTSESVSGPQVFYYAGSVEGKNIASCIQDSMNTYLEPASPRVIKENSDYYLLKNIPTPTVIVECGFLSNPVEGQLLTESLYQNKVARSIYLGICAYLDQTGLDY